MTDGELSQLIAEASTRAEPAVDARPVVQHVGLRTGTRWFALPAAAIAEVVTIPTVTRVPAAAAHVLGIAMLRSRLVPVVDLDVVVAGRPTPRVERGRLLVVRDGELELGLVAIETRGLLALPGVGAEVDVAAERPPWILREELFGGVLYAVIDPATLVGAALRGLR